MEDSSSSKPFMVTSSLNFKVTTPNFYNQPKKFASVAPPRPKSLTPPSAPSPTPVGTAVIGRVGDLPPPPPSLCDVDDDLPAPPPECQTTSSASEAPPPAFPAPPPVADDLSLPAPPEPLVPVFPMLLDTHRLNAPTDSLNSDIYCSLGFELPSQYSSAPAPKPSGPPRTAPKPALSFLPPPEMGDRPPPAPWAEELKNTPLISVTPKPAPPSATSSFPPPPAAPPAPPTVPNNMAGAPASNHKSSPFASQMNANQNAPAVMPPPQPKMLASPPASFNQPMKTPPASTRGCHHERLAATRVLHDPSPPGPVLIPGGGVPLNMREVEELERMTKDFIKDMDTHAPVITSAPTEVCGKCGEALSRTQPAVRAMDKLFHSNCFCCMSCHRPLQGMQFYDRDGAPQCEDCYMSSLAVCSRCGERITDRVLKAVGQCFHSHCFRCSTCSCTLEGAPFITDDNNNPYCVQDYHRRFSPLCVSCNEPIIPAQGSEETVRVVALDKNFHLKCYRCEDCARPLSIEADENGCYPLDGKILCMKCHTQRAKQAA
uniref:Zyxin n=1 Tax=Gasterosteus aculeatus TaxID=69293 RepID=G3P7U0_GASAC